MCRAYPAGRFIPPQKNHARAFGPSEGVGMRLRRSTQPSVSLAPLLIDLRRSQRSGTLNFDVGSRMLGVSGGCHILLGNPLLHGGPKAPKQASPGQRPGYPAITRSSPERAQQPDESLMSRPFRADATFNSNPGRFPGLAYRSLSGWVCPPVCKDTLGTL